MRWPGWCALFVVVLAARLAHSSVLWVEESYPAAAAIQILHGLIPYRDFVFDKPPLTPFVYLAWGAWSGVAGRVAGALYAMLCAWLAARFARDAFGEREAAIAAVVMAFCLTFYFPAAVLALAPDLLMVAPHIAAVHAAYRGRGMLAGGLAGVALLIHTKGLFVVAACLLWGGFASVLLGFVCAAVAGHAALAFAGAAGAYWDQVWRWGAVYASDTFVENPVAAGIRRVANWAGFHAAPVLAAAACAVRDRHRVRWLAWFAISLAAAGLGWRFSPRYFFQLLPVIAICAARGFTLLPRRWAMVTALLFAIPLVRFGPGYFRTGGEWADTAMSRDAAAAAAIVRERARPGDTILVWGYRPEIIHLTRLRLGTPWLDSQPLTGVLADRHLTDSRPTFEPLARENRQRLSTMRPTFVVDGLGPYNPRLGITAYPELTEWRQGYAEIARTAGTVIFQLRVR